ncbi:MAG: thymidine phosphorylase [Limnochordia bacterium]
MKAQTIRIYDMLQKKRDGLEHTADEIETFVSGVASGTIPDYQVAAWLMAVYLRGMTPTETSWLTSAMASSGECLDLSQIPGVKVDKHSTGGVGDKTTLVLAPLVASVGVPVAKMAGRGLGHTGGTLDKLESFPGMRVTISHEQFAAQVAAIGVAITGQTADLAPADRQLYALRDVTATVDSIPLIAASVISKKLAAGADAFVLDVKVGRGAFARTLDAGQQLAGTMVEIARQNGRRAVALITDMSQPLGRTVGNALEVREALDALRDEGPADLRELCLTLGAEMVVLGGIDTEMARAGQRLERALASGAALDKLAEMVAAQGGDAAAVYDTKRLPLAPVRQEAIASQSGYIQSVDAFAIGRIAMKLGAGRETKDDAIELSVGVDRIRKVGEHIEAGEPLAQVHALRASQAAEATRAITQSIEIGEQPPLPTPLVLARIASH